MGNDALLALSHRYMRGEISRLEYRQQRAAIIDEITGSVKAEVSEENDVVASPETTQPKPALTIARAGLISAVIVVTLLLLYMAK